MKKIDVPFCCACGKVKDELDQGAELNTWIVLGRYRMKHGFHADDLIWKSTACPECAPVLEIGRKKTGNRVEGPNANPAHKNEINHS